MAIKNLILCADDFAQNAQISQGILHLISAGRLNATSCMTESQYWPEFSAELAKLADKADVGLHFNLTHRFKKNVVFSLPKLMLNKFTRVISAEQAYRKLNLQLDLFEDNFNKAPDFIDGHQHVHQFFAVREALIETIKKRYSNKPPYVRTTVRPPATHFQIEPLKSAIIAWSGGKSLLTQLTINGIPHNADFGGIYNLQPTVPFRANMRAWLSHCAAEGLIMCHPGFISEDTSDPIRAARVKEYEYLISSDFAADLESANVFLTRFSSR